MVRAYVLSFILFTQASQSTQGSCTGGSCRDAGKESSVLMQRKSRRGSMQMRQAQQATALNGPTDLFQATAQLLRLGANEDVIQFTNDTLEALETEILPSLLSGYDEDMRMLNESFERVAKVLASFEQSKGALHPLRETEATAIAAHKSCRQREQLACQQHSTCVESCSTLNTTYIEWESEYLAVTETIHHKWCEDGDANKSSPFWRTSMATRFNKYLEYGLKRIESHQALTTCVTHCESTTWSNAAHGATSTEVETLDPAPIDGGWHPDPCEIAEGNPCDCMQRAMETASCTAEEMRAQVNNDFDIEWHIASSTFDDMVAAARVREHDRHAGFKALKGIKCLLKHIVERAGRPCDDVDEPGQTETIMTDCESYWQIDVHLLLMPWNLTYPEMPSKPEHVPAEPHPCTDEWVAAEMGWLSGECFSAVPACQECPVVTILEEENSWAEGPEDLVQVKSTEDLVQDLMQVRAEADGETRPDTDGVTSVSATKRLSTV